MAFHESHERLCPFCKARMSATAPKCFNCGRIVDEDEDNEPDRPPTNWGLLVGIAVGLVAAATIAFALRGRKDEPPPEDADVRELHQLMAERMGRTSLNESSSIAWAEFEPELRVGRPFNEVLPWMHERDPGSPKSGTLIGTGGRQDPGDDRRAVFLKDTTVYIHLDTAGKIVSWERRQPGS
jgi:hypothetical protein